MLSTLTIQIRSSPSSSTEQTALPHLHPDVISSVSQHIKITYTPLSLTTTQFGALSASPSLPLSAAQLNSILHSLLIRQTEGLSNLLTLLKNISTPKDEQLLAICRHLNPEMPSDNPSTPLVKIVLQGRAPILAMIYTTLLPLQQSLKAYLQGFFQNSYPGEQRQRTANILRECQDTHIALQIDLNQHSVETNAKEPSRLSAIPLLAEIEKTLEDILYTCPLATA